MICTPPTAWPAEIRKKEKPMENIPINSILPNPDQPRKKFDQNELRSLAQSIKEMGVLQPILVEEAGEGMYILQDGERRTRAAAAAGLNEIPAIIMPSNDTDGSSGRLMRALVANLQRQDLNPIEEARAYKKLIDEQGLSVRAVSIKTGIYESRISNKLLLLKLDEPIQQLIERGEFTPLPNAINMVLTIPDCHARIDLCQKLAARGLGRNSKAIFNSSNLLIKKLNKSMPFPENKAPNAELVKTAIDLPKWDILYQSGKVPSWNVIYQAALETCNTCPRRPAASEMTCKNCIGAILLSRIVETGNREKARNMARKVIHQRAMANGRS